MDNSENNQEIILRSFEEKWKKEGKTPIQIARLRYYFRHKKKILGERRSLGLGKILGRKW